MSKELNTDAQNFLDDLLREDQILSSKQLFHKYFQRNYYRINETMRGRVFSRYIRQKIIPIVIQYTPLCRDEALTLNEILKRASLPEDLIYLIANIIANTLTGKYEEYGFKRIYVRQRDNYGYYREV